MSEEEQNSDAELLPEYFLGLQGEIQGLREQYVAEKEFRRGTIVVPGKTTIRGQKYNANLEFDHDHSRIVVEEKQPELEKPVKRVFGLHWPTESDRQLNPSDVDVIESREDIEDGDFYVVELGVTERVMSFSEALSKFEPIE